MTDMLDHIKGILLTFSNTERSVYEGSSDAARRMRVALGLAVLMAPLVSGFAMGHFVYVALGSTLAAVGLGLWWGGVVGVMEFTISGSSGGWRTVLLRAAVAALIGMFTAAPVMLAAFDDRIEQRMEEDARARRQAQIAEDREARGLPELRARIDSLEQQQLTVRAEIKRASLIQDCELSGEKIEGLPCTGIRGGGPVYENAVRNEQQAMRRAEEIQEELRQLRARIQDVREDIDRANEQPERLMDPLAEAETLGIIISESWTAALFCGIIFFLTVALELMVVFIKMARNEDDYDAAYRSFQEAKKKIAVRHIEVFTQQRLDEIECDPLSDVEPPLTELMGGRSHRERSGGWGARGPRQDGQTPQERGGSQTSEAVREGSSDIEGGSKKTADSPTRGTSPHRNGLKLYSIAGALVFAALLELFSPVAPLQRTAGNALNAMPLSWIETMVGEEAAQRYANVDSLIESQGRQGMISADGVVLARHTANPQFPEPLKAYLIEVENHRFYRRYAVDWLGIGRALVSGVGGGSGLVQQLTGDVVLENGELMGERGWRAQVGKMKEIFVSYGMRDRFSQEELLRLYLQGIYLGHGPSGALRGFEEASWGYFDRPVGQLSEAQQLALVAILRAPNKYPKNAAAFAGRYSRVVDQLLEQGAITAQEAERLRQERPALERPRERPEAREVRLATRHARGYVQRHATDSVGTIRSTIDAGVSLAARRVLRRAVEGFGRLTGASDLEGFVLVADGAELVAMVGSVTGRGPNRADILSAYLPASLMKSYYFTEHLALGGSVRDSLPVRPRTFSLKGAQAWEVSNYTSHYDDHGPMPLNQALARSINVAAASLAVGPVGEALRERLERVGYEGFAPYPSSVLGARAVKPVELFRLLQAFARPYGEIPQRFQLETAEPTSSARVWPAKAAEPIARAMGLAVDDPHGTLSAGRRHGWTGRTHRGKTGTAGQHTSASLFVMRPGGVSVLMGVFRRSGKPMDYPKRAGGVAGSSLLPYVDALLESGAMKQRAGRASDFGVPSAQPPVLKAGHSRDS